MNLRIHFPEIGPEVHTFSKRHSTALSAFARQHDIAPNELVRMGLSKILRSEEFLKSLPPVKTP